MFVGATRACDVSPYAREGVRFWSRAPCTGQVPVGVFPLSQLVAEMYLGALGQLRVAGGKRTFGCEGTKVFFGAGLPTRQLAPAMYLRMQARGTITHEFLVIPSANVPGRV